MAEQAIVVNFADSMTVHIIESPSPDDMLMGRVEGRPLEAALKLIGIRSTYSVAVDKTCFCKALLSALRDHLNGPASIPFMHISCHGDETGIQFTDGDRLGWDDLAALFEEVNKGFSGFLYLSLSCCQGLMAMRMAMKEGGLPFTQITAPSEKPTWPEALVGFVTFYHQVARGTDPLKAADLASKASGCLLGSVSGEFSRKLGQYVERKVLEQQIETLKNRLADMEAKLTSPSAT